MRGLGIFERHFYFISYNRDDSEWCHSRTCTCITRPSNHPAAGYYPTNPGAQGPANLAITIRTYDRDEQAYEAMHEILSSPSLHNSQEHEHVLEAAEASAQSHIHPRRHRHWHVCPKLDNVSPEAPSQNLESV